MRAAAYGLLRLVLPLCLVAAAVIAIMGLVRAVGQPAASPVSQQSASLRLGTAGAGAAAPPAVRASTSRPPSHLAGPAAPPSAPAAPPRPVTKPVVVMNASGITGLAGRTATLLRARGVSIAAIGNLTQDPDRQPLSTRTVFYPPGGRGQAQTLAVLSGAPTVAPAPSWLQNAGRLVLVLTDAKRP